jgi:hypothetical protein
MRRWTSIVVLLLVILGGIAIGVSAYNAGVNHGLVQGGHAQVVRVVGHGFGFPFGLFLFPLFFFLILALIRGALWGRRWGGSARGHHGPWTKGSPPPFEDWHRRLHERDAGDRPGAGGEPAQV